MSFSAAVKMEVLVSFRLELQDSTKSSCAIELPIPLGILFPKGCVWFVTAGDI
jgi:hypothetical protein